MSTLSDPLKISVVSDHTGSALLRFTMRTRHFCTALPHNERKSYRINLEWMVFSCGRNRPIGIIAQSDHSYLHPEFIVNLPLDRDLILSPASPYLCEHDDPVTVAVHPLDLGVHAYRYEVEIGSASDGLIVGDGWSYREGRLAFANWFHGKAFRWSLDGARITLPSVPGCAMWINLNAVCAAPVSVKFGSTEVAALHATPTLGRWQADDYGFSIPASMVNAENIELTFKLEEGSDNLIAFNLRQTRFALSRVVVDIFGQVDHAFFSRLTSISCPGSRSLAKFSSERSHGTAQHLTQVAVALSPVEIKLLDLYFAPHSNFWTLQNGLSRGFEMAGVSASFVSSASTDLNEYESVVVGPLRFSCPETERLLGDERVDRSAVFSTTIPSLRAIGLVERILEQIVYRELFDLELPSTQLGSGPINGLSLASWG